MKTQISLIAFFLFSFSIQSQEFKFENELVDYGNIAQNANGDRVFVFTNIGKKPLIISNIQSSCGCTVPKWPKDPIMPGKKGEIKVTYDTSRLGGFSKQITIFSNALEPRKIIRIKGIIDSATNLEKDKNIISN